MERISAAENLTIETSPTSWKLFQFNELGEHTLMLDATLGQPLQYSEVFASTRRLPRSGTLSLNFVWQVVLGWSSTDEAWHLGLLLARDLADARGSRWCQMALWPDPDGTVFADLAQEAGRKLAAVLQRPFNLIPARERKPAPEPPLPELPLKVGLWTLERGADDRLQFTLSRRWVTSRILRIVWYLLLILVYVFLSVATLNTDLALPNSGTMLPSPELLPYLGLIVAAGLSLMVLYLIYELFTKPNRIVIEPDSHRLVAMKGSSEKWSTGAHDLQSIYVTQVVNKKGSKQVIYHGEINLQLGTGNFKRLIHQPQQEETPQANIGIPPAQESVIPLTPASVASDLQAAGLYIARLLGGIPAWYDQRVR